MIARILYGPLSQVPGPIWCKLSGYYISYFNIKLERTGKIHEWHLKYGPVICIAPGEVSVATPSLMREIYGGSSRYAKSRFFDHFTAYGEAALFATRDCAAHRQKRKALSSFYHNVNKPSVESFIRERICAFLTAIETHAEAGSSIDIYPIASYFAFDNICRLLYGQRHSPYTIEGDNKERRILNGLKYAQLWGPAEFEFPGIYPLVRKLLRLTNLEPSFLKAEEDLAQWSHERVTSVVNDIDSVVDKDNTLLYRLLDSKNKNGSPLTLKYIASETYDNLNAAQVTVAVALVYIIYCLSEHPAWQKRIRDEIAKLPNKMDGFPSFTCLNAAPLLDAFIREVYRMIPGTGGHAERVVPDGGRTYGDLYIPEGVSLLYKD